MKKSDPEQLRNLWKKGETLYSALFKYTAPSLVENYYQSEADFANYPSSLSEKDFDTDNPVVDKIVALGQMVSKYRGIDKAKDELKWDVLDKILSEKIIGLGYQPPKKISDSPQIIPLHVWPEDISDIDWDESSFSCDGIEFLRIRLIKFNALKKEKTSNNEKAEIKLPDIQVKGKKPGRPSIRDKIIEAYESLKIDGKIDFSQSLKSHTELIQQTVKALHPEITDNKGMQHEVIRRTIGGRFKADKTSKL